MLQQSITKTDLVKQEAFIAEWKKDNDWRDDVVVNANKARWNFPIVSGKPKKPSAPVFMSKPVKKTVNQTRITQDELQAKLLAQQAGNIDPDYYYYIFKGRYARKLHRPYSKTDDIEINQHAKFYGVYAFPQGKNWRERILNLLETYEFIDVDKFLEQHTKVCRYTILPEARKLELHGKVKLVRSFRHGQPIKFVERMA